MAVVVVLAVLIPVGTRRRAGRAFFPLDLSERVAERVTGLPGWAAVPTAVAAGSLITAVFGLYWDVSLHMDRGRGPGPLANPSHYFILAGLLGIFAAGWLAAVMPARGVRPGPAAVRITADWHVPLGGAVMLACSSFALLGFPLDDVWHRLFGQDVTLWGPTHMMMLTGAALTLIEIMVLMAEGRQAKRDEAPRSRLASARVRMVIASGGLLVGLSIYQGEFDFGAPQFRMLYQPALIALAASVALVAARMLGGRGAALGAAVFFVVVRGVLTLVVAPGLGETVAHFPLYLVEALIVEGVALTLSTDRPYRFAFVCGGLIGTVGVLAEDVWTHVWMPLEWPAHLLPGAVAVGLLVALAGAVLGAFLGSAVRLDRPAAAPALGSVVIIVAVLAFLTHTTVPAGARGQVTLTDAPPAPHRTVNATLRVTPKTMAADPDWLVSIAWQGRQHVETHPLRRVAPGVYETATPVRADGSWKSALRFARGTEMASIPLFMPADPAIPAKALVAAPRFERAFVSDAVVLQRERKPDASGGLWHVANAIVASTILVLLGTIGWALRRLSAAPRAGRVAARGTRARIGVTS